MRPVHRLSAAQRQQAPKVFSPIARLKQLQTTAPKVTMNLPYGLCIGPNGTMYVVQVHTADGYGAFVAFTAPAAPYGIAIDSARKRV